MPVPYTFATASGNIPLSHLDTNFSNVKAYADTAGTVVASAQPNITSVGTLNNLTVTGNVTATRYYGDGSSLTGISAQNSNAASLTGSTLSSNVTQSSLTRVGTLSSLSVSGTASVGALTSTGAITTTGAINASSLSASTIAGTMTTTTQPNIRSLGTLTSLTVSGTIIGTDLVGNGRQLFGINASNISGTVASATTAGTVTTAAQPNITSVGTLSSLSVTGNITAGNVIATNLSGPVFMANVSAGQGVPTSPSGISQLPLVYDNVIANVGGDYSVGNSSTGSIFTASVPGFYQVSSAIGVTPSNWANVASYSSTGVVGIYVNDNPVASGPLIDFAGIVIGNIILQVTTSSSISTLVELNAGDTLKCKLAYLTTAPSNFWNTSTNLVQGYFQAAWIRS